MAGKELSYWWTKGCQFGGVGTWPTSVEKLVTGN